MKFAWKVTLATLGIIVLSFSVGSYLLVTLSFRSALEREITAAREEMQMLGITCEAVCEGKGMTLENLNTTGHSVRSALRAMPYFSNRRFQLTGREGQMIYSALGTPSDTDLLESVDETSSGYTIRKETSSGATLIHCAGAVYLSDGALYIETVRDISSLFADRETHYTMYRYILLLVAAVSGGVLFVLSSWLTQPIRSLGRVADQLAQGDYSHRAKIAGGDEISDLAGNFNRMADAIEKNVQELEESARRQEDFTASFVHELKTPLTSIIGYADMLRSRDLGEESRFKAASYIFSEGKRLENLSLSLMDLLVVGHGGVETRPVQMKNLCEEAVRIVRPALSGKDLTLEVRAEEGVLQGDGNLLQTLLVNLLDNARKASLPGGTVTLTGEALEAGYRLRVIDQGCGIPPEELGKITEAFYMVDKSRSRAEGGAGLGLALCRQIAEFHRGALRFESQVGKGTMVSVTLGGAGDA